MEIDINKIIPSINNPRKNFNNIEELAEDIKKNGLIHKILVKPLDNGTYEIVQGERRFKALQLLRRDKIDCEVRELTEQEANDIRLSENIQREDLSVIELANEFKKRLANQTQQELAKQIGKSQPYINKVLSFLDLSYYAQVFLDNGYINKEQAKEILYFQKYLKMLDYDKQGIFEYQGRNHSLMDTLIADLVDWIVCNPKLTNKLHILIDNNILVRIRYATAPRGTTVFFGDNKIIKSEEPIEFASNEIAHEILVFPIKKSIEWCTHDWTKEHYDYDKNYYVTCEEYCSNCGALKKYIENKN